MTDPNHPIFKQFPELDPKLITIRDTPHPDWVWNQPPIAGTLTPGYAHRIPGQPYMPGSSTTWTAPLESSQVQFKPQEWQADFPGLWDDVPGSGTRQVEETWARWLFLLTYPTAKCHTCARFPCPAVMERRTIRRDLLDPQAV
ncbi:hypothetical protein CTheo_4334 [Ceratobasidium theobromae]|uniref:Uncharacterized protein n=1 Tax=Ceratobasidium theobromae TaxID=1582974 RepID=A0A5N5QLT0_9AGAM|nr:hypothetical protein CTheo_4334 [Ceratobasidium theobromae]